MASLQYINSKLSDAVYQLTVHEGDARTRLAKVLPKIIILPVSSFPQNLQKECEWIRQVIQRGIGCHSPDVTPPHKVTGIKTATYRKVIEKLFFIQDEINTLIEKELEF